jgi:hypothetical protein
MKKLIILFSLGVFLSSFLSLALAQSNEPALEQITNELAEQLPTVKVLPGQALYLLKIIKEKIEIFTTYGAKNQAKLYLKFAETRLAEYKALRQAGKEKLAERALEMYTEQLNQAIQKLAEAKKEKSTAEEEIDLAVEMTQKHLQILQNFYNRAPEPARKGLQKAMQVSQHGYEVTKELFSGQKREEIQEKTEKVKTKIGWKIKELIKKLWPM